MGRPGHHNLRPCRNYIGLQVTDYRELRPDAGNGHNLTARSEELGKEEVDG